MNARLTQKIEQVEKYIEELTIIRPSSIKEYLGDIKTKAACERYLERIIEGLVDIAHLKIKEDGLRSPEDDKEAFDILFESGIISKELCISLKEAKGMRNILAHQYGDIDDSIIFESIDGEIEKDVLEFVKRVIGG